MNRTKLSQRVLPRYSKGEEIMNTVTHIAGGGLSCIMLAGCILRPIHCGNFPHLIGSVIYGISLLCVYTISSVYHGLRPGMGKKVMQVLDHCMIYFLIAGTYTPITLIAILPKFPVSGALILCLEWGLGIAAAALTAIDLRKYRVFSMFCYIAMGWCIILFLPQTLRALTENCFLLILYGGIVYTIGAVLFGFGTRIKWMHSVFHIFVILGSVLQFLGIYIYIL